ncbi:MAG: WYL domain-containing protein [Solobacterium sp.]|nr:WYL domain-containing protein [Solobacterium sp.]
MKPVNREKETILLILQELSIHSDEAHRLSMPQILAMLESAGYPASRKTVYSCLEVLRDRGYAIRFSRSGGMQGYWLERKYTPAEILFLQNAVAESVSLSPAESTALIGKLDAELSIAQQELLEDTSLFAGKTDNDQVLSSIGILLQAIRSVHTVLFHYYDLSITQKKQYRKNQGTYEALPAAILSYSGRYYCVLYSLHHHSFANYRIDRMSGLAIGRRCDPVRFDRESWIRSSFMMYRGEPDLILLKCDHSLASAVFDQFGRDILITEIEADSFTVAVRSSISPTLISWILMFYDRIEVKRPNELILELQKIARFVLKTYSKDLQ